MVRKAAGCGNVVQCRHSRPAAGTGVPYERGDDTSWPLEMPPFIGALIQINVASLARTELDARSLMLVRLAVRVSVDTPASSYPLHIGPP